MNIGMVVASLSIGGLERMVCDLTAGLRKSGHHVSVFCTDEPGALYSRLVADDKECGDRRPRPLLPDFRLLGRLVSFVRRNHLDVLHAHNHVAHRYAVMAGALCRVPVVCTCHGQGYGDRARTRQMRRFLARQTRCLVAVSDDVGNILREQGVAASRIRVIRNGVPIPPAGPAEISRVRVDMRQSVGIKPDAFVIGSVGRFMPEKNYELLIRAFAECLKRVATAANAECGMRNAECHEAMVKETAKSQSDDGLHSRAEISIQHPGSSMPSSSSVQSSNLPTIQSSSSTPTLLIVGDGPRRGMLEELIGELGIRDRVILPGMQDDVWPWLRSMDVFCLSSHTEGTSLTLLEAALCSLPLIATNVGGNREIIRHAESGFLVPPGDASALADGIEQLAGNASLCRSLGMAAKQHVEQHYLADQMVDEYLDVYGQTQSR